MQVCHDEPGDGTTANAPMQSVSPLRDNDVLFGRGKGTQNHPGNVAFRALVDSRKADYWLENQEVGHKTQLAQDVYDAIVTPTSSDQPGGRFLKQEDDMNVVGAELQAGRSVSTYGGKYYVEVPRKVAVDKCKMALRQKVNAADQREARRRRKRLSTSNGTEKAAAGSGSSIVVAAESSGTNDNANDLRPDQISSTASAMMGDATSSTLDQLPVDLDSLQFLDADLDLLASDDSTSRPLPSHHLDGVNEGHVSNAGKAAGTTHPTTTANVGAGGLQDVNGGIANLDQIPGQSPTEPTRTTPLCDGIQDLSLGGRGDPGDPAGNALSSVIETALVSVRMYQSALEAADGFDANSLGRILYDVFADASEGSDSTNRLTKPSSRSDGGAGPAKRDRRNTASYQPLVAFGYPASLSHLVDFLLGQTPSEIFYTSSAEVESDLRGILRTKIGDDEVNNETSQVGGRLCLDNSRLFGREEEIQALFTAYDRVVRDRKETRTFVSISGYSGTGKTSLVHQLSRRLLADNASLIRCNFTEQGQSTKALFTAFDDYFRHMSGSEDQEWLGQIRHNVKDALGSKSYVLFGCLPSLRSFLGEETSPPPVAAETKEEAMNQVLFYFFRLVRTLAGPEHPIVFVFDDIQWCNENTLELVKSMLRDTGIVPALFIGCYRDEEVGDDHCFADLFGELAMEESLPLVSISLQNVDADGVNAFVSSVLHLNPRYTRPLAQVLHRKTQGNPMFVRQLLLSLVDDGSLVFSAIGRRWTWQLGTIAAKPIANNSVSFMVGMMKSYPERIQNILRLVALLGTSCRQDLLEKLLESYGHGQQFRSLESIREVATGGILISDGSGILHFSHDQLFQAARALTPSQEHPRAHLDIGRRLLRSKGGNVNGLSPDVVATIVDQYNEGVSLITDHEEELMLAELNLLAGEIALNSASYLQAAIYFLRGCGLVREEDWNTRYNTCLRLYTFSGEAQITQGMAGGSIIAAKEVLKHGRSFNDKLSAHQALLTAYTIAGHQTDAIQHGISVLKELGEDFPIDRNEQRASSEAELVRVGGTLKSKSFDDIVNQSIIGNDYTKILTMQVLMVVTRIAYLNDPTLMLLLVFRMVSKSMTSGLTAEASFAFAALSFALCGLGQYDLSSFCARVATSLLQKFEQKYSHIVLLLLNCSILPYSQPQQACAEQLYAAYEGAMSIGAVEWGVVNLARSLQASLFAPDRNSSLQDYFERIVKANAVFVSFKHHIFVLYNLYLLHAIPSLMSGDESSSPLSSLTLSEEILDTFDQKAREYVMRRSITLHVWFSCLFGVYTDAKKRVDDVLRIVKMNPFAPSFDTYNECFYTALIAFSLLRNGDADKEYWERIAADIMEKFSTWAAIGSGWNFKSKVNMLVAEQAFCRGTFDAAKASYVQAAHYARETGFIHEEALACELAGDFHCTRGELLEGRANLQRSIELYLRWGAHRKAIHVRKKLLSFEQDSK